jgi:hypothetical protein
LLDRSQIAANALGDVAIYRFVSFHFTDTPTDAKMKRI